MSALDRASIPAITKALNKLKYRPDPYVPSSPSLHDVMEALAGDCRWCKALQIIQSPRPRPSFVWVGSYFPKQPSMQHCTSCHRNIDLPDYIDEEMHLYGCPCQRP